jgi:hypothetical protein
MHELDYFVDPEIDCPNGDTIDATFIRATATIGGHDAIEEYVACKMYPLAIGFGFDCMLLGMTPVSKVETPLPLFAVGNIATEHANRLLAEIEAEAKKVLGSFRPKEYDALCMAKISNGGRLNLVLEQMGVSYAPLPLPGTKASHKAIKKRKAEVSMRPTVKRAKTGKSQATPSKMAPPPSKLGPAKKIGVLKIAQPKARVGT